MLHFITLIRCMFGNLNSVLYPDDQMSHLARSMQYLQSETLHFKWNYITYPTRTFFKQFYYFHPTKDYLGILDKQSCVKNWTPTATVGVVRIWGLKLSCWYIINNTWCQTFLYDCRWALVTKCEWYSLSLKFLLGEYSFIFYIYTTELKFMHLNLCRLTVPQKLITIQLADIPIFVYAPVFINGFVKTL